MSSDVDAYSGYKANERPLRFWLDAQLTEDGLKGVYEIEEVEDRWYDPDAEYFKVRTMDYRHYVLRHDLQTDQWFVLASFDGKGLLMRQDA